MKKNGIIFYGNRSIFIKEYRVKSRVHPQGYSDLINTTQKIHSIKFKPIHVALERMMKNGSQKSRREHIFFELAKLRERIYNANDEDKYSICTEVVLIILIVYWKILTS